MNNSHGNLIFDLHTPHKKDIIQSHPAFAHDGIAVIFLTQAGKHIIYHFPPAGLLVFRRAAGTFQHPEVNDKVPFMPFLQGAPQL